LAGYYLFIQLSLSRLLLFQFVLEGFILNFQLFALLDDAVNSLADALHLFL